MTQVSLFESTTFKTQTSAQSDELWLRFLRDRHWSRMQKNALLEHFSSLENIVQATPAELRAVAGRMRNVKSKASRSKVSLEQEIDSDLRWLQNPSHHLLTIFDARYPTLLREIDDPPLALFAKGDLGLLEMPMAAIVGSRRPSPIGKKVCQEIAATLSTVNICVVSGLALGIDGEAHRAALNAGGSTVAILGSGIDVIYPHRHRQLYDDIANSGLLLSEYPLGYPATKYTFPDRNRIVSGLSAGVVIVEAAEKSGTIITARLAVEQNRELMVVPGPALSTQYKGSHRLIREGASLVVSGEDVVSELAPQLSQNLTFQQCDSADSAIESAILALDKDQAKVLKCLDYEPILMDDLVGKTGFDACRLSALLIELELSSMVAMTPEGSYIRAV